VESTGRGGEKRARSVSVQASLSWKGGGAGARASGAGPSETGGWGGRANAVNGPEPSNEYLLQKARGKD